MLTVAGESKLSRSPTQLEPMDDCYLIRSYAKINVTLDILGKRRDGYHDLASVMQTIDIYDTICLTAIPDDRIELVCSHPDLNTTDNLVVRAAQAVRERLSLSRGVKIELVKRIPIAAGLGGGSGKCSCRASRSPEMVESTALA